jgi:hypothetical protein
MRKPHAAARFLREALTELDTLRRAAVGGDGFADGFPAAALAAVLRSKLAPPELSKADWGAHRCYRPDMKQNAGFVFRNF